MRASRPIDDRVREILATAIPIRSRSNLARTGSPQPRLADALHAVERGLPVLPLYPYSKYPAVQDWEHGRFTIV